MADKGKWTGASTSILPTTSWAAPANLFPTADAGNTATYSFNAATSTVTVAAAGLPDGYLLIAAYEFEDTSNGRHNPQGKFIQTVGTGDFVSGLTGGYNRDNSEDRSYVRTWAFVNNPSASAQFQFQIKRDSDAPTGGTVRSVFEIIPLYYSNHGIYRSTSAALYGGTTPNQVTGFTSISESDTAAIELASDVITLKGDNKRYIAFGSQFFEGRGGRTQRWHGFRIDGVKEDAAKSYSYYRSTTNDETGEMFTFPISRATTDITIDQFCYRGDGTAIGQGGADVDGSTPALGDHATVVIELNDSAELFGNIGSTAQNIATTGPIDMQVSKLADVQFNDSASFTRSSDTGMNVEVDCDVLLGANMSAAGTSNSTGRFTGFSEFTVDGVEDASTFAGDYLRGNQGTTDTWGWSANILSALSVTTGQDIGVSSTELPGSEGHGGGVTVQSGWAGFWGLNLDTMQAGSPPVTIDLDPATVAVTGGEATFVKSEFIDLNPTTVNITGADVTFSSQAIINLDPATVSVSGGDVVFNTSTILDLDAATVSIAGGDVTFDASGGGGGGGTEFTLEGQASSGTWDGSNMTFSGIAIGDADSGRLVSVAYQHERNTVISATIGGVTANIDEHAEDGGGVANSTIISAIVPTGTTADIVFNMTGDPIFEAIKAYRLIGFEETKFSSNSDFAVGGGADTSVSAPSNTVAGSAAVGVISKRSAAAATPVGFSDDFSGDNATRYYLFGSASDLTAETPRAFSGSWVGNTNNSMCVVVYEPSSGGGGVTIDLDPATVSITGGSVDFIKNEFIDLDPATVNITGADVTFSKTDTIDLDPAVVSIGGGDVEFVASKFIDLDPATVTIASGDVNFTTAGSIDLDPATVTITGGEVTFNGSTSIDLEPATVAITSGDVTFVKNDFITLDPADVSIAGGDVDFELTSGITLEPATVSITGGDVEFVTTTVIDLDPSTVSITSSDVTFSKTTIIDLDPATVEITAGDVDFVITNIPAVTCILVTRTGDPLPSLTQLSWAWFDEVDPALFTSPTDQGDIETTGLSAEILVQIPNTGLSSGEIGTLVLRSDDGVSYGVYNLAVV